ncbi:sterol glucosyltransferase [Paecilomyces variotii No. 5]|uniref:Sterol glucosyltransferase n=1 Tax=Byssochlamys spectabilis (strain No. 5 / NBRC 109023) TaxID=1356009 RepID=V5I2J9_BYSSN|nr:sterol glucosyltransferase [Paecilomyces variotii No. 5]
MTSDTGDDQKWLQKQSINDNRNVMTIARSLHEVFSKFTIALESAGQPHEYTIKNDKPNLADIWLIEWTGYRIKFVNHNTPYDLPDPILLETHAIIARILHATGMAEQIDRLQYKKSDSHALAGDGTDGRIDLDLDSPACRAIGALVRPSSEVQGDTEAPPSYSEAVQAAVKLNIVIQIVGSRGDVQPFIALGQELRRYGHRVRLATHGVFESWIKQTGLEFFSIGGNPKELMAYMVKNPGLIPQMKNINVKDIQKKRQMIAEMLDGCWMSCIEDDPTTKVPFVADAIIANPPSFAHIHCAQALGIPVHLMFTMPWTNTREVPHPLANVKSSKTTPTVANYLSYSIVEWLTWQGLSDIVDDFRARLDLEPVPTNEGPSLLDTLKIPFTYCWSPALMRKPQDWPHHIDVCGFFFREVPDFQPPPDLVDFIQRGPKPIYIGFGSIVVKDPQKFTATVLQAIRQAGVRAVVSRGWNSLDGDSSADIFYLDECPHEWLFQHVAAVVHHGGAGTTACGLRYGRPTAIVPFFGDQPFWGRLVATAGAGPAPIPYRSLNSHNLSEAIRLCLRPEITRAAEAISDKMGQESGVQAAVHSFYRHLPWENMRCNLLPDRPACWVYKKSKTKRTMLLSKAAAQILLSHSRISAKDLRPYETKRIEIKLRRYDPLSSTTSAFVETGTKMVKATGDIFLKPYQEYERGRKETKAPSIASTSDSAFVPESDCTDTSSTSRGSDRRRESLKTGMLMVSGSAKSAGRVIGSFSKGAIVDIPLATTEGLRAVPRLYGEEVEDYGTVTDWKSGGIVAGKTFVGGMKDRLADLFVQPYKGGKEEGALGVAKGVMKGTLGVASKCSSAALGLVAYSGQGILKSVHDLGRTKTKRMIAAARVKEGEYLEDLASEIGITPSAVIRAFEAHERGED